MITNDDKKIPKNPKDFLCQKCNYITSSKKDYNKHLLTRKHQMKQNETNRSKLKQIETN